MGYGEFVHKIGAKVIVKIGDKFRLCTIASVEVKEDECGMPVAYYTTPDGGRFRGEEITEVIMHADGSKPYRI